MRILDAATHHNRGPLIDIFRGLKHGEWGVVLWVKEDDDGDPILRQYIGDIVEADELTMTLTIALSDSVGVITSKTREIPLRDIYEVQLP